MFLLAIVVASLAVLANAKPTVRDALVLHEARQAAPAGFAHKGSAPLDSTLNLRIALVQSDITGLEKVLYDVSTPSSPNYGQHLSKEEVEKYVKPSDESVSAVMEWLSANNLTARLASPAGDWLSVSIPVARANDMFGANFSVFSHEATGKEIIRTLSYSIPANLKTHIDFVHPTITFTRPSSRLPVVSSPVTKSNNLTSDAACSGSITPSCLQSLYGIPTEPASESSNKLAVSGFIDQYANQADLQAFLREFRTDIYSSTTFSLETIDDGSNPQSGSQAGVEANLDTQYTVGVATGVPVVFISVGDDWQDGDLEGFLDIINYELEKSTPDYILTTSYGENEEYMSTRLANNLCNTYMQLGARGTSILFASGDGGVSGSQSSYCSDFVATFPSGCPYMTSVGATTGTNPETAADFSSGGFSNIWDTPSYQSEAVSSYLNRLGSTYSGRYNSGGRAYPDVSAQGQYVEIVVDGQTEQVAGTSCSSPIFASVISLINDELIAAGKSPLGFLNPWLYSDAADAFTDITSGSNPGCNTNGFPAESGWDPVTGLGTPNYSRLRAAAGL